MLSEDRLKLLKENYSTIEVEKISTPEGMPGDNWHRYIIGLGRSKVEGMQPGSLKAVTKYATEFGENLYLRATGVKNTAYSTRTKK